MTPLGAACATGKEEVARYLIEHWKADPDLTPHFGIDYTPLLYAASQGHADVVRTLLIKGADANKASKTCAFTPFFVASIKGHSSVVSILTSEGADVNRPCFDGRTPLYSACERGHEITVIFLLFAKDITVNRSPVPYSKDTPLGRAMVNGHFGAAKVLIRDPRTDVNRCFALHLAVERGQRQVVELLLRRPDVDVNKANPEMDMETPLHAASRRGDLGIVKALLRHRRIDKEIVDGNGKHALEDIITKMTLGTE